MFNPNFYPTPLNVIELMTEGINLEGKVILEPSAGKGDIVDFCAGAGASLIACEINKDLQKILQTKCKVLAEDFLTVTSDQISHIDLILMNPPFSAGVEHILHAYSIAPKGCKIIALCNASNLENTYTNSRKELLNIIQSTGDFKNIGDCFTEAERQTGVKVALIHITKPGESYQSEFEGFFTDEEPTEAGEIGLMSYNVVRDLVNRYVAAVKLYDEQLNIGQKMNSLLNDFYGESLTFTCTEKGAPKLRNEFKKDLQKDGWKFIFNKMDMKKHMTRGLKEEINKFVEQQTNIPFTMRNIYHMLDMVVQTHGQRMDKALLEVFDRVTQHHDDNKYHVAGWKTNSHFLLTKKFIVPNMCFQDSFDAKYYPSRLKVGGGYCDMMEDLLKALCYISGDNYDKFINLSSAVQYPYTVINKNTGEFIKSNWHNTVAVFSERKDAAELAESTRSKGIDCEIIYNECTYGKWFEWAYFKVKGFKKGTMHFEFKDADLWAKFNQRVSKLKGYPLFEGKEQTAYQNRQTGRAQQKKANPAHAWKPTVLFEIKVA